MTAMCRVICHVRRQLKHRPFGKTSIKTALDPDTQKCFWKSFRWVATTLPWLTSQESIGKDWPLDLRLICWWKFNLKTQAVKQRLVYCMLFMRLWVVSNRTIVKVFLWTFEIKRCVYLRPVWETESQLRNGGHGWGGCVPGAKGRRGNE